MKLIVFTSPEFIPEEANAIDTLFRHGLDLLHLRKPNGSIEEVAALLERIPQQWHRQIMLHDFDLSDRFELRGLHLNRRRPSPPVGYQGKLSAACHSLEEVAQRKEMVDYLFLSPIYDSISKQGYQHAFSLEQLKEANSSGLIDRKVMALGGISLSKIPEVEALGFGGVALLGDIWKCIGSREELTGHFDDLRKACDFHR